MADAVFQLVARLPSVSGIPADTTENTIHVGLNGVLQAGSLTTAMQAFRDFYTVTKPGMADDLGFWLSESVSRSANACSILAYATLDLSGQTPFGSPVDALNFTMGAPSAAIDMPEEVAIVVSYNADLTNVPVSEANPTPPPATIRPQQRRRGRLYFGPLSASAVDPGSTIPRPHPTLRGDLGDAFSAMANVINAVAELYLGVWSRADAEVYEAVGGYVDDAWDTQRRRGLEPTTRTTFSI